MYSVVSSFATVQTFQFVRQLGLHQVPHSKIDLAKERKKNCVASDPYPAQLEHLPWLTDATLSIFLVCSCRPSVPGSSRTSVDDRLLALLMT